MQQFVDPRILTVLSLIAIDTSVFVILFYRPADLLPRSYDLLNVKPKITRPALMLGVLMRQSPKMRDIGLRMPLGSAHAVRHEVVRCCTPLTIGE